MFYVVLSARESVVPRRLPLSLSWSARGCRNAACAIVFVVIALHGAVVADMVALLRSRVVIPSRSRLLSSCRCAIAVAAVVVICGPCPWRDLHAML
ncbi:hypothetical protein EDB87DRAFT_1583508, partial [Lactarius vividus]